MHWGIIIFFAHSLSFSCAPGGERRREWLLRNITSNTQLLSSLLTITISSADTRCVHTDEGRWGESEGGKWEEEGEVDDDDSELVTEFSLPTSQPTTTTQRKKERGMRRRQTKQHSCHVWWYIVAARDYGEKDESQGQKRDSKARCVLLYRSESEKRLKGSRRVKVQPYANHWAKKDGPAERDGHVPDPRQISCPSDWYDHKTWQSPLATGSEKEESQSFRIPQTVRDVCIRKRLTEK